MMQSTRRRNWQTGLQWAMACMLALPLAVQAGDAPATVAEAVKILDLVNLPLAPGADKANHQTSTWLSYQASSTVAAAYDFHVKQLLAAKFVDSKQGYVSEQSASGTFTKEGFVVSLSVSPTSAGKVSVMLIQHGNVDYAKLPLPAGTKPLYVGPSTAIYVTEATVEATAAELEKNLLAKGWKPYGKNAGTNDYKQNGVKLGCMIQAAPGQGGKTTINFGSLMLSQNLPAPAEIERLHYADNPVQLEFDTPQPLAEVFAHYQKELAVDGWQATTENPIASGHQHFKIFRNPAKDMLTLKVHTIDGKSRGILEFETAAEVAAEEARFQAAKAARLAKEELEAKQKAMEKPPAAKKIAVAIPAGAAEIKVEKEKIEFKFTAGKAQAAAEGIAKQLVDQGWKLEPGAVAKEAGVFALTKDDDRLHMMYVDSGFFPAEISLNVSDFEFEATLPTKAVPTKTGPTKTAPPKTVPPKTLPPKKK